MDPNAPTILGLPANVVLWGGVAALVAYGVSRQVGEEHREILSRTHIFESTPESRRRGHKRPVAKAAIVAASRARRQDDGDLARRLERGEIRGDELRELMATGKLHKRNPHEPQELTRARALSLEIHGKDDHVAILDPAERRPLPRYVAVMGPMPEVSYEPLPGSSKDDAVFDHTAGDRGGGEQATIKCRPLLVVDPVTRKPAMVLNHSPMKVKEGWLVG